jgi:hypothetical protein
VLNDDEKEPQEAALKTPFARRNFPVCFIFIYSFAPFISVRRANAWQSLTFVP